MPQERASIYSACSRTPVPTSPGTRDSESSNSISGFHLRLRVGISYRVFLCDTSATMSRRPPNPGAEKAAQNQATIKNLLKLEPNKVCADCKRNKRES